MVPGKIIYIFLNVHLKVRQGSLQGQFLFIDLDQRIYSTAASNFCFTRPKNHQGRNQYLITVFFKIMIYGNVFQVK